MFPKKSGTPKWMVLELMENPMNKWMIWGVKTPLFLGRHPYVLGSKLTLFPYNRG